MTETTRPNEGSQRVALVMAASKGLGRACADGLARSGHALVICARKGDEVQATARELREHGVPVEAVVADVSKREDLQTVFARVDEAYGRLDVLVANAGGPPPGAFLAVTEDGWQTGFQLTLMSAVRSMQAAVPLMRRNGYGRIVVIGSSSVKDPIPNLAISNTFRPALYGCVKTLSQEVAGEGITVNMVSAGRIDTDRVRSLDESRAGARGVSYEEQRRDAERAIPAGRYGQPEELGALVAFLASDEARYITGQSILVDGGYISAL